MPDKYFAESGIFIYYLKRLSFSLLSVTAILWVKLYHHLVFGLQLISFMLLVKYVGC